MSFCEPRLRWLEAILQERFGHPFILSSMGESLLLSLSAAEGCIVFDQLEKVFSESRSDFPCFRWDAKKAGYSPVLGQPLPMPGELEWPGCLIEKTDDRFFIHYDILGLTFWMLTRLEEVGRSDLDGHSRFPAVSSHAYQHDYLERPIVDEWLDILGQVIEKQWPDIKLKSHQFRMKVTHDVDRPSKYGFVGFWGLVKGMLGDAVKRRDIYSVFWAPLVWLRSKKKLHQCDPANTFDWIMEQSEKHGHISDFYFICGRTDAIKDALYEPDDPAIVELMKRIYSRGHRIGLHPSYNSYQDAQQIEYEAGRLKKTCNAAGVVQDSWGGRMHFLRWEHPGTMRAWEQAGMSYDSTLGYADHPGFRCGTCHSFSAFDPVMNEKLKLRIRPLIAMEGTVISSRYMGLGYGEEARRKFLSLKESCRKVEGDFVLLWHNNELHSRRQRKLYVALL